MFSRDLKPKVGTEFAGLEQKNMPPLLSSIHFLPAVFWLSSANHQHLVHPLSSPFPLSTACPCMGPLPPPPSPSSCLLQASALPFSLSGAASKSFYAKFCQGCTSTLEYNWKQNLIVLSSRSCFYLLLDFANCLAAAFEM